MYYVRTSFISVFKDALTPNAIIILTRPFIASIYFAWNIPISYDEAYTYLFFTSKPFFISFVFYPAPNNHILHSFLTNITDSIPFFSTLFRLRLPVIFISLLTWITAFSFIKRFYSERAATSVVALSSVLFLSLYYSYMSRGYAMVTLFFIICLYCVYSIIKNGSHIKYWTLFSLATILGFYTMPTFLYPYMTLNIILLIFKFKDIKKIVMVNVISGSITLLLYLPIIILNGFDALFNNEYVSRQSWSYVIEKLPGFLCETMESIFGIPYWISLLVFCISGILLYLNKKKFELSLWIIFGLAPFVLLLLHNVIPFPRTFLYYGFIIVFFLVISLNPYLKRLPNSLIISLLVVAQIIGVINFNAKIDEYESFNTYSHDINKRIIEKDKTYYMNSPFCTFNHQFELASHGIDYNEKAFYDWDTIKASADTIYNYDYVIIDRKIDETRLRKPYYSNYWQNVYKKE